eukprot:m.358858 g.358858  ORF g.358858 m.358858 type:complete len:60 (+) comp18320_c0_seq1:380-559(+)
MLTSTSSRPNATQEQWPRVECHALSNEADASTKLRGHRGKESKFAPFRTETARLDQAKA